MLFRWDFGHYDSKYEFIDSRHFFHTQHEKWRWTMTMSACVVQMRGNEKNNFFSLKPTQNTLKVGFSFTSHRNGRGVYFRKCWRREITGKVLKFGLKNTQAWCATMFKPLIYPLDVDISHRGSKSQEIPRKWSKSTEICLEFPSFRGVSVSGLSSGAWTALNGFLTMCVSQPYH